MMIDVPRPILQAVFDAAVNSMDFGSGFLEDSDVAALRAVACLLGVDPVLATPGNFRHKYLIPLDAAELDRLSRLRARRRQAAACALGNHDALELAHLEQRAAANGT
jgi:hypothetical protein